MVVARVRFPAHGEGEPTLEGELWLPDGDSPVTGVVVAHPHPQRGGSMNNNVVYALCEGLQRNGVAWLRFNFRGVGRSDGSYGGGEAEVDDVLGALAFLAEQPGIDAERVGLAGYSFGARVSLAAIAHRPRIRALLCVAPPLREPMGPDSTPPCPFLVLVGDRDGNLTDGPDRYASNLPAGAELRIVPGTDHFWRGFEPMLAETCGTFFTDTIRASAGSSPGGATA